MIEIQLENSLLILTEEELKKCLLRMPFTMEKALKRGQAKTQQQGRQVQTPYASISIPN